MRVLMIVPDWPSSFRPYAMPWLYHQVTALAHDHDITVMVLGSATHYMQPKYWVVWNRERTKPKYQKTFPQTKLVPVWHNSLPRQWLYRRITFPLLLSAFRRALNRVKLEAVDIIHAHFSSPAGTLARRLSLDLKKPYIVTEHASNFDHLFQTGIEVKQVICDAARVFCVSPLLAEKIRSRIVLGRNNLQVVPNGVDLSLFQPAGQSRQKLVSPRLLFVGYLVPHKGVHILLDALEVLRAKGVRCTLQIVGEGPENACLKCKAESLGLGNDVFFSGYIGNNELAQYYQQADILILPSFQESFGVVVIEALACGVPVIATRCGGPETIIREGVGRLVEPGNVAQLAKAIQEVCEEYQSFDPLCMREYVVNKYSLLAIAKRISRIYQEVVL